MTAQTSAPQVDPDCLLCGRPFSSHSFNTRDICNMFIGGNDDVSSTVRVGEGDTGGAGQGGVVSSDAAGQENLRRAKNCLTCNDRGEVGWFVSADSGYQTDVCPDCGPNTRPPPDSEGVEALEKLANDVVGIQEDLPNEDDRNTLGYAAHYLRKFSIRPQASAGERGITDAVVLAGAKAIYIARFESVDQKICDEHFDWYEVGKSNPDSCVHYSNVAFALRDARACLSATLEPGRGK